MTGDPVRVPGRNELVRAGVGWKVAAEYRRLVLAGVDRATAGVLARGRRRARCELPRHVGRA